jgi:hypothetical protein
VAQATGWTIVVRFLAGAKDFSLPYNIRPALAHPAPCPPGVSVLGMKLTTHPRLSLSLRVRRDIFQTPPPPLRLHGVVCTNFTFCGCIIGATEDVDLEVKVLTCISWILYWSPSQNTGYHDRVFVVARVLQANAVMKHTWIGPGPLPPVLFPCRH